MVFFAAKNVEQNYREFYQGNTTLNYVKPPKYWIAHCENILDKAMFDGSRAHNLIVAWPTFDSRPTHSSSIHN